MKIEILYFVKHVPQVNYALTVHLISVPNLKSKFDNFKFLTWAKTHWEWKNLCSLSTIHLVGTKYCELKFSKQYKNISCY